MPGPFTLTLIVIVALSILGLPIGLSMIAGSIAYLIVSGQDLGIAGATQQLVAQVGTTVGMNGLEATQVASLGVGLAGSYRNAFLLGTVVVLVGTVLATGIVDSGERRRDPG